MRCALFPISNSVSRETSSGYGFGERRVRPLCHLLIRQQTWQETTISAVVSRLQLHQPTREADMVHSSRARPTPYVPPYSPSPPHIPSYRSPSHVGPPTSPHRTPPS